jgi:hypothetical protein
MIKAILDGRKTQTRRVINPQPRSNDGLYFYCPKRGIGATELKAVPQVWMEYGCPYGQVGNRLWVRETWATEKRMNNKPPSFLGEASDIPLWYKATLPDERYPLLSRVIQGNWRPSVRMPRWASRITLEITEVRVERVQEISEGDAIAEGCLSDAELTDDGNDYSGLYAGDRFYLLWDSLNAKRGYSWSNNPWVWVISFKEAENHASL